MFVHRILIATALALALASGAHAGPRWPQPQSKAVHSQRNVNDVIGEVENRYGGKVVGVRHTQQGDHAMYRVRVLQRNGRVKTVMVPAERRR